MIDSNWLRMESTLAIIIQFIVYNPNLQILNEKRIVLEFLETGGFINMENEQLLINMKLYRLPKHSIQGAIIMLNGLVLCILSFIDIRKEIQEQIELERAMALEQEEEANAGKKEKEGEEQEDAGEEEKKLDDKKDDKKSEDFNPTILYMLINCSIFQKINFSNVFLAYCSQILKYVYDSYVTEQLEDIVKADTYTDVSGIFIFNQICMFFDSIIICIGAISLLKYTSLAV